MKLLRTPLAFALMAVIGPAPLIAHANGADAQLTVSATLHEHYALQTRTREKENHFVLAHRLGGRDLQRQVLTKLWHEELKADFALLHSMSARKRASLTSYCPEPLEIRLGEKTGWICESTLSSGQQESYRRILQRLRHVSQKGWHPPAPAETPVPPKKQKKSSNKSPTKGSRE
jgi:hypothetical protein